MFKVGDTVRFVKAIRNIEPKEDYIGRIGVISGGINNNWIFNENVYVWHDDELELIDDELLLKFYDDQLYINLYNATATELEELERIIQFRWASGDRISMCDRYTRIHAFMHCEYAHEEGVDCLRYYNEYQVSGTEIQIMSATDFVNHFIPSYDFVIELSEDDLQSLFST